MAFDTWTSKNMIESSNIPMIINDIDYLSSEYIKNLNYENIELINLIKRYNFKSDKNNYGFLSIIGNDYRTSKENFFGTFKRKY